MVDDGKPDAGEDLGAFARLLYRERRTRDSFLSEGLFGEPAWDILLDLFASQAEGKTVQVSSACIAAAVPASTALRYIAEMERRGLIKRAPSTQDRRSYHLTLTDEGRGHMEALLKRLCTSHRSGTSMGWRGGT
jgi:DNA-binding MarR family transcriptional regulator